MILIFEVPYLFLKRHQDMNKSHQNANVLDADLSSISVRNCYGLSPIHQDNPSILALGDDEFIISTGSNLRVYNDTLKKSKLLQPQIPEGVRISLMVLSFSRNQLAVVVDEGNFPDTFKKRERARIAQTPSTSHTNRPRDKERMSSQSNRMLLNKTGMDDQDNSNKDDDSIPEAKLYIYDLKSSGKRPQVISYRPEKWTSSATSLAITCIDFSSDGLYFAIAFNVPELGVLIYDSALLTVVTKVSTSTNLTRISFHPQDSSKLCTIGHNNTCCMWRIAGNKNAYLSPIHKLTQIKHNWFTCLAWLEPTKGLLAHDENSPNDDEDAEGMGTIDNKNETKAKKEKDEERAVQKEEEMRLLVGSGVGYIIIVQATEQIQAPTWPFGCPPGYAHTTPQEGFLDTGVATLLYRGDHVIALSNTNAFCILELKKYAAAGAHAATAVLLPLQRSRVSGVDSIIGMQWMSTSIQSSYEVVIACPDKIVALETNAGKLGSRAGIEHGLNVMTAAHNDDGGDETKAGGLTRSTGISMGETPGTEVQWNDVSYERVLTNYHEADIHSLAVASRTCLIATASATDQSIQVRDFSDTTGPAYSLTSMNGSINLVSNSLDMHPTGMFLASGCEDEAIEYIITDTGMEVARKIHVKVPFTLPNGTAFVNMHPVTLVKYSHTGHLLAVAMGKNVQVFHMYDYTLSANYSVEPKRVMTMTDHTGYITDLAFNKDDSMIFTTASDGVVYSWKMVPDGNNNGRVNEYRNMSTMSANHVVVTDEGQVIVTFIPNTINPTQVSTFAKNKAAAGSASTSRANTGNHRPGMAPPVSTPVGSTPRRRGSFTDAASRKRDYQAPGSHNTPLLHSRTHGKQRKHSITDSPGPSRRPSNFRGMPGTPASGMSEGGGIEENPTTNVKLESVVMVFDQDVNPDKPEVHTYVYGIITSICCGVMDTASGLEGKNKIVCFGMLDGSVVISKLPLPLMIVNVQLPAMRSMSMLLDAGEDSVSHANKTTQSVSMVSGGDGQSVLPSGRGGNKSVAVESVHEGSSTAAVPLLAKSKTMGSLLDDLGGNDTPSRSLGNTKTEKRTFLNEAMCKCLQLHTSAVSSVTISTTGLWIFSASHDGSVYMLSTSMRARSLTNENIPEKKTANENNYVVTDKEMLLALRTRLADVDTVIDQTKRESDRIIHKLTEDNRQHVFQLEERMKRETSKRDEIIIKTREDLIKQSKALNKEIAVLKTSKKQEINQLESDYEKRLARENLYLNKMKQAYDEYVVHARLDMAEFADKAAKARENLDDEHERAMHDLEKEKSQMLMYIEYVKEQNQSVIAALDGSQEEERRKLGEELAEAKNGIENATRAARSEIAQLQIDIQKKDFVINKKEDDVLKMQADLGWANERIKKLETALAEASTAITKKVDLADHWEFKVGEQQQQIVNLEKVRKALTTQLHSLRQELAPEREKLSEVTDKLSEVDREYELSLQSISEKEEEIVRRGSSLNLLQKQIRDLRYTTSQKERALMRAAKVLGEYQLALREAQFESVKRTLTLDQDHNFRGNHHVRTNKTDGEGKGGDDNDNRSHVSRHSASGAVSEGGGLHSPGGNKKTLQEHKIGDLVEIMKVTPHMVKSLTTLQNLLAPYESGGSAMEADDEIVQAVQERERHVTQLHQTVNQLKSSLNNTEETAIVKVKKSLSDNQLLLEELNHLRTRTKRLNQDNQRQKATIEMMKIQQNISAADSTTSLTHNRKYRDGRTLENSFQEGTNQSPTLRVELPSGLNTSQTTGQDFNYYAGSLSLSEELNIAAVAERTSKKVQKQTQGIKKIKSNIRHTLAAAHPQKKDFSENNFTENNNSRGRHNTIAATGGNKNDGTGVPGRVGGNAPLQSPLDNFQSGPALNENSIVSVDSNQPKDISLSRYLDEEDESNSVINNKNQISGGKFKPSSSQLSADEKIAQIMAENDKKIKEMRANNSAEDILTYYQTQLKTPPTSRGTAGKNDKPGARAGKGKQNGTTTTADNDKNITGSAGNNKAEVKMKFIKGRDITLPDIDNKQL